MQKYFTQLKPKYTYNFFERSLVTILRTTQNEVLSTRNERIRSYLILEGLYTIQNVQELDISTDFFPFIDH